MNDQRPTPPYDPTAAPPPLPAAAKKQRTVWWVLGGVVVIFGALYVAGILWLAFQEIQQAGETFEEQQAAAPAAERGEPTGPVNRRVVDKTSLGGGLVHQVKLDTQLAAVAAPFTDAGFTEERRFDPAALTGDGTKVVELELGADREYVVIGVCDDDCSDLDLTLIDENDNVVDEDYAVDAHPMVSLIPAWTGSFSANVEMIDCFTDDCLYTLAVYSRPAPVEAFAASASNPKSTP